MSGVRRLPPSGVVALAELSSPMPPLRAKGLASLRALLLARDEATLAVMAEVVGVVETALADEDSYVFLAAINVLVALADVAPEATLPLLAERLTHPDIATPLRAIIQTTAACPLHSLSASLTSDVVVVLCPVGLLLTEVLEKAARQCGERDHTRFVYGLNPFHTRTVVPRRTT